MGWAWLFFIVTAAAAGCGSGEREVVDHSGLVLRVPEDWVATPVEHGTTWSGPRGGDEWKTTLNVHAVEVRTDEVARTPEAVAMATAVELRHMDSATSRVGRGARVSSMPLHQVPGVKRRIRCVVHS